MMRLLFILPVLMAPALLAAKDLGVRGDVWPVAEQSLLSLIETRLKTMEQTGELAQRQADFKNRVTENTLRPAPVEGPETDTEPHTVWYDPTFTVRQDLADDKGRVFARKGQQVNPLESIAFAQTLYFLDADDPRQVAWMNAQTPATVRYKVILTRGNIREATQTLNTRIYFDQGGALTSQLGIRYIPAVVTQEGNRLRIVSAAMTEGQP
ncbi:TPA: type-F conjugative transfer system protein TraW [Morganella morganii]